MLRHKTPPDGTANRAIAGEWRDLHIMGEADKYGAIAGDAAYEHTRFRNYFKQVHG